MEYSFKNFILDISKQALFCDEAEVSLEPKAFDVLCFLATHSERVVSKEELIDHVWEGRFTSDAALATSIKVLRKALGDTGDQQKIIKTIRGKGFRFVADLNSQLTATHRAQPVATLSERLSKAQNAPEVPTQSLGAGRPSIVVLPFQMVGQDRAQDSSLRASELPKNDSSASVIAEGLAHELIQSLARLRWLRVIARGTAFRFLSGDTDWQQLAEAHHVRYVLSGVLHATGREPVLNLELADCRGAEVIWAERLRVPLDSMQTFNQKIIGEVVTALELYIPSHEAGIAAIRSTENLGAWEYYHLGLRHMFSFSASGNATAANYFSQAVKYDPAFARAYAGLSFTRFQDAFLSYGAHGTDAKKDAREFAEKALTLDTLDPFTNFNFGRSFWLDDDVLAGQGWLEKAIKLSPNFAQGHYSLAFSSVMLGEADIASASAEQSLNLSPLDPLLFAVYAVQSLAMLHRENMIEASRLADKAARTPGAHYLIHMIATAVHAVAGESAKAEFWRQRALLGNPNASIAGFMVAVPIASTSLGEKVHRGLLDAGFK